MVAVHGCDVPHLTPAGESVVLMPETILNRVSMCRGTGRTMTRAKIVCRPLTPYSRYLFDWCIPGNVAAGEYYPMVDVTSRPNPGVPERDFWLFDEAVVVHLNYRPDGTQINRALIQEPDIGKYLAWRDLAMESAVPFSAYRA